MSPSSPVMEHVVVTCCAPADNNQNPKYANASAAMYVVADLSGSHVVNWTVTAGKIVRS